MKWIADIIEIGDRIQQPPGVVVMKRTEDSVFTFPPCWKSHMWCSCQPLLTVKVVEKAWKWREHFHWGPAMIALRSCIKN